MIADAPCRPQDPAVTGRISGLGQFLVLWLHNWNPLSGTRPRRISYALAENLTPKARSGAIKLVDLILSEGAVNKAIEMHDSECVAVEREATGQGSVLLDAYVHRTDGEPGVAPGEGGVQRIRIRVNEMVVEGEVGELPACIFEGSINFEKAAQDNMVPFPAAYSEPARISMMLSPDARVIVIAGSAISIEPEGEFRFVEHVNFSRR